jgi:hypothetical protein
MHVNLIRELDSSFLSCEKDTETILKKLFIEDRKHSEELIRLLTINTEDCLDNKESKIYQEQIKKASLKYLKENGYVRLAPKLIFPEHEEVKSYIIISFDNFTPNRTNPQFRDCIVHIDVICHTDCWDIGDFRIRPLKICGYIDGLLNESRLSGIGKLHFLGANQLVLDENLSGYSLMFEAVHGSDDEIEDED